MPKQSAADARDELHSVARLDSAEKLSRKLESLKSGRWRLDQQWKLNLAFYRGKQYSYINRGSGRLETLPTDEGSMPRFRVRIVSNQIVTGSQSLLSKLTKTKPILSATPGSASDHDVKAAQMAEDLLEFWWQDLSMEDAVEEVLLWGIIAGQGYWKITWDEHAGKAMQFMVNPAGQPILDDPLKEAFRGELEGAGLDPQEFQQTVYMGDIKVETLSPFDVYLDPSAKTFADCKYAICIHHLDPDEIETRWGVRLNPDSTPIDEDVSSPGSGSTHATDPSVKKVFTAYFLPSAAMPKGRYVVWVDNPAQILQDDPWPYPINKLPLIKFPGVRIPGSIYDSSVVEHGIPLQKELNRTISQIVEYKNLTIKPRVWAPVGSMQQKLTTEPGAVYEYTPIGGQRPELEKLPTMPPYVFEHLREISSRLRDLFSLTEVTEGAVPPNVEAGIAIDLLQEMSTDRIAPTIKLQESALADAGQLMLALAQEYYIEPRLLKIRGSGGSVQVRKFTQADIAGGISIHAEAGSGLPRTRAGRQARIQSYIEMGVLKPDHAWKYLDIADMKSVSKQFQADEDMAYREHDKLAKGIPTNPVALANAQMQIQTGMNPQTGMAFQTSQEIISFVEDAAIAPWEFENLQMHADTHGMFLKSVEFESLPDDMKQRYLRHYELTVQKIQENAPQPSPEPIRTSLQLKGTVGPTGAAEILSKAGASNITPDVMAEPPLETVVLDQIDKPDVEEAGNDPLTAEDHAATLAEREHELALKTEAHTQDLVAGAQDAVHKEEQHLTDLAMKRQKMVLAQRQARKKDNAS